MNGISQLRTALALALLVMGIALGVRIHDTSQSLRALKADLATLDDVRYGVFNSDEWSTQLKSAIDKRIDTLDLTSSNSCLLYTSPSPRDLSTSRMPSSA